MKRGLFEKIERKLGSGKKNTKRSTRTGKKKVNYPWLKKRYSRRSKAYMCYLVDSKKLTTTDTMDKKQRFDLHIYKAVTKKFPKLFDKIATYYK